MLHFLARYTRLLLIIILAFSSCTSDDDNTSVITNPTPIDPFVELNLPESSFNYSSIELPDHFVNNDFPAQFQLQQAAIAFDNTPADNAITDAGATLGRVLFYDEKLSQNGTVACATCHQQEHGFSDPNVLSIGFDGGLTGRHSMSIVNARYYVSGKFFWDERAATLEDQVLMPFQDPVEMGLTLDELEQIVSEQTYYPVLFADAFGDETISSERISRALAQFIRSIVSTSSRYDQARVEVDSPIDDFPGYTQEENLGKRLFYLPQPLDNGNSSNCSGCHASEVFVGPIPAVDNGTTTSTNNGLDLASADDLGIFEATGNSLDIGKFKAPSLINIAIRPPYMHDGRFATLEEVVEHYSTGIKSHPTLTSPLANDNGEAGNFNFTDDEKEALLAFLNTLTDQTLLNDEKYSDPFR